MTGLASASARLVRVAVAYDCRLLQAADQAVAVPGAKAGRSPLRRRPSPATLALSITALAAVLRFATVGVQSAWLDEAIAIRLLDHSFASVLSQLPHTESTPPLYYVLVWGWTRIFGSGVFAVRAFSALAGTLTVPLFYIAGRRFGTRAGLWAAALAAISPLMFYYSQESRPYALLILLATASFVAWQRTLEAPGRGSLGAWWALSVLALLTHYFFVFLFVGEAIALGRRAGWRRLAAPIAGFAAVGGALVPLAISQSSQTNWIEGLSLASRFAQFAKELLDGPYGPWGIYCTPLLALLAAAAVMRLRDQRDQRRRRALLRIVAAGAVALALPLLLAVTGIDDVFDSRNMVALWTPAAILVAAGLARASAPRTGMAIGAAMCAISALVIAGTELLPSYQRDDWRGAAEALIAAPSSGRVIVAGEFGVTALSLYMPGLRRSTGTPPTVSARELDFVFLRTPDGGPWRPGEDSLYAPAPPGVPSRPPAPFRLVAARRTSSFATYEFLAPIRVTVAISRLRREFHDRLAEVGIQSAVAGAR